MTATRSAGNFADALAAGPVAGLTDGTLLLVPGQDPFEAQPVVDHVNDQHPSTDVVVVGGEAAVATSVMDEFR